MTVRSLLKDAQAEIRQGDLTPGRASELLVNITALLSNVLEEIRDAEMHYNAVLLQYLDGEEAANRAKIRAMTTPEYLRSREAKDTQIVLTELIRSLRQMLRTQGEEMRLTR